MKAKEEEEERVFGEFFWAMGEQRMKKLGGREGEMISLSPEGSLITLDRQPEATTTLNGPGGH